MNGTLALNLVQTTVVLMAVIALANFSLKHLGKKMQGKAGLIQIVEKVSVSNTSSLSIVRIDDRYYLMSLSDAGNAILKELDPSVAVQLENERGTIQSGKTGMEYVRAVMKRGRGIE